MGIIKRIIVKIKKILREKGFFGLISIIFLGVYWRTRNLINKFQNYFYHRKNSYKAWIKQNEHEQKESELAYQPKISIIVPVYNTPKKWLELCILSVLNQTYPNWELCLFDNGSNAETGRVLIEYAKKDQRIKVGRSEKNLNIVGGSNGAIKMATGEFISLLDSDDELAPFALYEVVKTLNSNRRLDFIYSDEDKIDQAGNRFAPFFKPDINPDLLLSMNYISHLGTYRKSIIDKIAGFRRGYDGAQDYDLLLRFLEKTKKERVHHIPKILYHWRVIPGSTAAGHGEKDYAAVAAKKAIADYLKRNNISGQVIDGLAPGAYRVKRNILGNPLISIIIPFQDGAELTKKCLNSIKKSNYENYEVILVRHGRQKKETDRYLKTLKDAKVRIYDCYQEWDKEFNHSALNNLAVNEAKGEYLLLLNNDVEIITSNWIEAMLEQAQRPEAGAVGAKLLYDDNRIQHAGVILGMGVAGHAMKLVPDKEYGYFSQAAVIRDYAAVTAACLMIKKEKFLEVGGFDVKNLPTSYNDVDLCLKLLEKGYLNVYTPYAKLYHHESVTRGVEDLKLLKKKNVKKYRKAIQYIQFMEKKWGKLIENDPYYSPNLSREREDFSLNLKK